MKPSRRTLVSSRFGFAFTMLGLSLCTTASAVISIDNTSTTATDPGSVYDATFLNWNNVGTTGTDSGVHGGGVYLRNGWVLAPQHIGAATGFYFNSINYPVLSSVPVWNNPGPGQTAADLVLYQVDTTGLPTLQQTSLASSTPAVGTTVLMTGFGHDRQSALTYFDTSGNASSTPPSGSYREGYLWASNSNSKRWGTNVISDNSQTVDDGAGTFPSLITTFTDPNTSVSSHTNDPGGNATPYEASASPGDSGGGIFVKVGSTWELAGMVHAIDPYPSEANDIASAFYNSDAPFSDSLTADGNTFSARTYMSDLSQYADQIDGITAAPEPASMMLIIAPAMLGLLARRGRR